MKTQFSFITRPGLCFFRITMMATLLFGFTVANAQWTLVNGGRTPSGALEAGNESDGTMLYIARIHHEGGIHVGKARANAKEAFIPYGGMELAVSPYEIYTSKGRWVAVPKNKFPKNAIVGGRENDGSLLYIARAYIDGGLHIGKVRANGSEAFIPFGGREEIVSEFEVLSN